MDRGATILLVDDSEDDVFLFERVVAKNKLPFKIQVARNGLEAKDYMQGQRGFSDRQKFPLPQFIITDNNMPGMSGKEFLIWLKEHPGRAMVPILMFSGAASEDDVSFAYKELGVQSYIFKPATPDKLEHYIKAIFNYWAICAIPGITRGPSSMNSF